MSKSKGIVLVITKSGEVSVGHVLQWLEEIGQPFVRMNTDTLINMGASVSAVHDAARMRGKIRAEGKLIEFAHIKSVWFRRPEYPKSSVAADEVSRQFVEDEFGASLWSIYTCLNVYWMNHPLNSRHLLEHNKLYQLKLAAQAGLQVPATVITNDADDLLAFCRESGGQLALKAVRSRIFQTEPGLEQGIYTNKVSLEYLEEHKGQIGTAPLMAQEYIEKKFEFRVTIVGKSIFTCAIHSQDSEKTRDDWRHYDFEKVKHEPYVLPSDIQDRLLTFMHNCGLNFGAIDMILTPEGEYVFLEVNPSGQFGWIEGLTGMPISKAIAKALSDPKMMLVK